MTAADGNTTTITRRRIALAVGTEGMGSLLPLVLKTLAAEEPSEIEGTFVEDQNLLNLAALPVFKEVCRVSRTATAPLQKDLTRQLRLRADAVRDALLKAAEDTGARWSFHVAQGTIHAEAQRSAQSADMIAIAAARRSVAKPLDLRLYAEEWVSVPLQTRAKATQDAQCPIALFVHGLDIQEQALSTATAIARRFGRPLIVLTNQPTIDLYSALVNRLGKSVRLQLVGIGGATSGALVTAARQAKAALLITPALPQFLEAKAITEFHEEAHAPTILIRAPKA